MRCKETAGYAGIGFLAGAVAGMAVGILYSPHSGRITRGLINERIHEATQKAAKIVSEAKDKAEDIINEAKAKVRD